MRCPRDKYRKVPEPRAENAAPVKLEYEAAVAKVTIKVTKHGMTLINKIA